MDGDDDEAVRDGPDAEGFGHSQPHVPVLASEAVVGGVEGAAFLEDAATNQDATGESAAEHQVSPGEFGG